MNGEEVFGWTPQPLSLGKNLEDIHHFLWDTSIQVEIPLNAMVPASSKVNAINIPIHHPGQIVDAYTVGLRLVCDSLMSGLHELEVARNFDRGLA